MAFIIMFSSVIYETWTSSINFRYLWPKCGDLGLRILLFQFQYEAPRALFISTIPAEFSLPTINHASYGRLYKTRNTSVKSSSIINGSLTPECGDLGLQVILLQYNFTMHLHESRFGIYTADMWNKSCK
jgi:hypothetical protein